MPPVHVHALELDCTPLHLLQVFAAAFDGLRRAARACVRSLAFSLGVEAREWLVLTDLDVGDRAEVGDRVGDRAEVGDRVGDRAEIGDATAEMGEIGDHDDRIGGPSVLRLYEYKPEGVGCGCHAHADLGLLTLSPAPTIRSRITFFA